MAENRTRFILINELNKRKLHDEKYSMRAFARDLGISSGRLSDILKGRRHLGPVLAKRILQNLELLNEQQEELEKIIYKQNPVFSNRGDPLYQLNEDQMRALVDWEYFTTLSLLETKNAGLSKEWVASRLNITSEKAQEVLTRLERLQLIERKRKKYFLTHKKITTTTDVPSDALKEAHRQNIYQALSSLYEDPVGIRDISSISMAVDLAHLPEAKLMIKEFRAKMSRLLEKGQKTEVYNLNIQLFPTTKVQIPIERERGSE